jgi:hypothetical protein
MKNWSDRYLSPVPAEVQNLSRSFAGLVERGARLFLE